MRHRVILRSTVVVLAIWLIGPLNHLSAQQKYSSKTELAVRARRVLVNGLRIERLAPQERRHWEIIKNIAFATDDQGRPWHATLVTLWTQLEASGHAIYLELQSRETPNNSLGGMFRIEQFDPRGIRHTAVIRLYLTNIDKAYVGTAVARPDGFIPFENLSRNERYVEVLGHEMAHASWILSDLKRAQQVKESVEQTNEIFLSRRGQVDDDPALLQRLQERDVLLVELEAQAEALEAIIWHELLRSKGNRAKENKSKHKSMTWQVSDFLPSLPSARARCALIAQKDKPQWA